jgi:hypothetical protein
MTSRSYRWMVLVLVAAAGLLPVGCAQKTAKRPAPRAKPVVAQAKTILPEWAPQNPSPEFLRAWKVLKPIPTEEPVRQNATQSALSDAIWDRARRMVWPAAYEFFGSLTDKQTASFLSKKELSMPYKSLREDQRKALEHWFAVWVEAFKGGPAETADFRVLLYKLGAKEDFSNVRVGFWTHDTHVVGLSFWLPGKTDPINSDFAQL